VELATFEQLIWQGFCRLRDVAKIQYEAINEFSFYAHVCTIFLIVMAVAVFFLLSSSPSPSHFRILVFGIFPCQQLRFTHISVCLFPHNVIKCQL